MVALDTPSEAFANVGNIDEEAFIMPFWRVKCTQLQATMSSMTPDSQYQSLRENGQFS